jgi:hypothetical protein
MKKHEPDPILKQEFDEREKKKKEEDIKYEKERIRNIEAMTPEQRQEKRRIINEQMLKTIKES